MARRITVLFIETGNHGGGSFESLYQNISCLNQERFMPIVVYLNRTHQFEKMKSLGVEVYLVRDILYNNQLPNFVKKLLVGINWALGSLFPRLTLLYEYLIHLLPIITLRRLVRKKSVDLIHLNNNMVRHFFCIVGLKDLGIPIISYLRSFIIKGANPFMAEYSNKHVSCYVSYSEGVKEFWGKVGVDTGNVKVIPNGIKIANIEPIDVWDRCGIKPRKGPLIGCVGAVKVNRTYDYMIKSFVHVLAEEPEAFLVIVGRWMDPGLGEKLLRLAYELGIDKSVKLHGHDDKAAQIIAGLDMLTIPYRVEPYGRILMEAWLAKTPVIATRVGKIEQIITNGNDGLLVEHGDELAMSEAVLKIWRDKALRDHLTREGYSTVKNRFSIEKCTRELEKLYEELVFQVRKPNTGLRD